MWAGAASWLSNPLFDQNNLNNFGIFAGVMIVLLCLLSLGFIFFRGKKESLILSGIIGATFFTVFGVSNFYLLGVTILILLFIHSDDMVSGEINERLKMNSRILIRKSLANLVLSLFILISFAAFYSPAIESYKNLQELPSASTVFIKNIIEQTLGGQLAQVESQQKDVVLNQVTSEVIREANLFLEPYFDYAPPVLAFGLFLVLWGVGWIFIWLALFIGLLLFQILKKAKFFKIEERDVKAEVLTI
ncbi:MAG: hypothetical protein A3B86_01405 [Candidatus Yanofskybacteria bacterium RIFCSPHIGHO2_02_FULL_38_22b]|uniref:Uncharacterized protein n=1 Tax=Candidatus Yanofskybacteria bacterium RIFCSPHIGHO2_02_FULL_38_22b TaxID=1802673 RepID=A0A1F8F3Z3_9BACT|nr:MAG: hypothetical protein A3B86_01405 [Candidatus Yanofskybacteria bacterium RIFCSPHIGHO2_02_FULL_38_22b]